LDIRSIVFIEEQNVPVDLEIDHHDSSDAIHFLGKVEGQPLAASRVCVINAIAKIQRVAVLKPGRGKGYGRDIMNAMITMIRQEKLSDTIALDAQTHALEFYRSFGFETKGDEFDDAGIPHIYMTMAA